MAAAMSGDPPQARRSAGALTTTDQHTFIHDLNDKVTPDDSCRLPAELVIVRVVEGAARKAVLERMERAWVAMLGGCRLDVVAEDLRWCVDRLTTKVDRQLATAEQVLDRPVCPLVVAA